MFLEHMNGTLLRVRQIWNWTRRHNVPSRIQQWLTQALGLQHAQIQNYVRLNAGHNICHNHTKLRAIFPTYGIPAVLVSNNEPSLVRAGFKQFLKRNAIKHVTTTPFHLSSNG